MGRVDDQKIKTVELVPLVNCVFWAVTWAPRAWISLSNIYVLFVSVGPYLQHVGSFTVAHRLSGCDVKAPECSTSGSCGMWAWFLHGRQDLSSPTRDWTHIPCTERQTLNHWTSKGSPVNLFLCEMLVIIHPVSQGKVVKTALMTMQT